MQQVEELQMGTSSATTVNARLTGRWNGAEVIFDCDFDPPWNGSKKGNVQLPPDTGRHDFKFHLIDPDHIDLQFVTGSSVLDANETGTCPAPFSGVTTDQIVDVSSNGQLAKFSDLNDGAKREIGYGLNLTSKYGACPFDPVISNGGGGND